MKFSRLPEEKEGDIIDCIPSASPSVIDCLHESELISGINSFLSTLAHKERTAVYLYIRYNKTLREISDILNI